MGRKNLLDDFSDEEIMDLDETDEDFDEEEEYGGRGRWLLYVIPSALIVALLLFAGVKFFAGRSAGEKESQVFTEAEGESIEKEPEEPSGAMPEELSEEEPEEDSRSLRRPSAPRTYLIRRPPRTASAPADLPLPLSGNLLPALPPKVLPA